VNALELTSELFIQPLLPETTASSPNGKRTDPANKYRGVVSADDVRELFPSIPELLQLHANEFLPKLQTMRDSEGVGIGEFFVASAPWMKVRSFD
jgi:hypothetical protein